MLFRNAKRFLNEAIVSVDKFRNQEFREELEKYLKIRINKSATGQPIKELRMEDSRSDNLLQMADVICGAIGRSLKADESDHRTYRPLIIEKEGGFQKWPKKRQRKIIVKKKSVKKPIRKNLTQTSP